MSSANAGELVVWLRHPTVECWNFAARHLERVRRALPELEPVVCESREEFLEALPRARIVWIWRFEEAWLELAPRLECIATPAAGRDYFQVAPRPGLHLEYGSFHGEIMAETALAWILSHARGIAESAERMRRGDWPRAELGRRLATARGQRLTVLGFGHIGRAIGRAARGLGLRVTGVRRRPRGDGDEQEAAERVVAIADLDEILPGTDALILALPGGRATEHLLDARRLGLLPPRAWVGNLGRGSAIDEAALARALGAGELAAAYLDVFEVEPLASDSPLRSLPNAFLLPHASAIAPEYLDLFVAECIERYRNHAIGGD